MKRLAILFKIFIISGLIVTLLGTSCKKENSSTPPPVPDQTYYFKYKDIKYEIGKSMVFLDPNFHANGLHRYHIYLTSQGIEYDTFHNRLTGIGNGIIFDLVTEADTSFAGSDFNIHPEHFTPEFKDIMNARIMLNGDFQTMDGEITSLVSGSCTASKNYTFCKFTFGFTDLANDSITGLFTGYFEQY